MIIMTEHRDDKSVLRKSKSQSSTSSTRQTEFAAHRKRSINPPKANNLFIHTGRTIDGQFANQIMHEVYQSK